jgi:RNA polymerase sigma factor (sigma-70 family)
MHCPDIDDIFSAGRVGVIKAARKFDGRGQFSTYAKFWIKREILEYVNRKSAMIRGSLAAAGTDRPSMASLDAQIADDSEFSLIETLVDPHAPLADYYGEDLIREVRRIIASADDISAGQKSAVLSAITDGEATQQRSEALCRFRQCTSKTARKIKEMLYA